MIFRNPQGCQKVAGGWSASGNPRFARKIKTTRNGSQKCRPMKDSVTTFGVQFLLDTNPGVSLSPNPRLPSVNPSGCKTSGVIYDIRFTSRFQFTGCRVNRIS